MYMFECARRMRDEDGRKMGEDGLEDERDEVE